LKKAVCLGEKLELHNIPFLYQEHTSMREANETLNVLPVSSIPEPGFGTDLLTEVLRSGARELLTQAVEQEVQEWLNKRAALLDERGRMSFPKLGGAGEPGPHGKRANRTASLGPTWQSIR
jgi:hypothetical protein